MTDAGPRRVTRASAYAVCLDDADRILLCRIAPVFAELAVRLVL